MKIKRVSSTTQVKKVLSAAAQKQVRVGFFETAVYSDGTPVAYIAAIQEFGYPAGNIPPRSFMRTTEVAKKVEWGNNMAGALADAIEKKSVAVLDNNLTQVGGAAAGDIARTISRIQSPPLAESTLYNRSHRTVRRTQSTKPLVDSGKLLESVTFDVVDK